MVYFGSWVLAIKNSKCSLLMTKWHMTKCQEMLFLVKDIIHLFFDDNSSIFKDIVTNVEFHNFIYPPPLPISHWLCKFTKITKIFGKIVKDFLLGFGTCKWIQKDQRNLKSEWFKDCNVKIYNIQTSIKIGVTALKYDW